MTEHAEQSATCAPVWHELQYGLALLPESKRRDSLAAYLDEVVRQSLPIIPYDQKAAGWHAAERARLARRGRPPAETDGQIAAIAAVNHLIVVTANTRDFRRFRDLEVENWTR